MAPNANLPPLETQRQLIDLVTQYIFNATAIHNQVGSLAGYLVNPAFLSAKIRPDRFLCDIQTTYLATLLYAGTGLPQPALMDDWTHLFLDEKKAESVTVFQRFQNSLKQFAVELDKRNATRVQPFRTFDPRILDSSVAK